jgi:hypothetical protein
VVTDPVDGCTGHAGLTLVMRKVQVVCLSAQAFIRVMKSLAMSRLKSSNQLVHITHFLMSGGLYTHSLTHRTEYRLQLCNCSRENCVSGHGTYGGAPIARTLDVPL